MLLLTESARWGGGNWNLSGRPSSAIGQERTLGVNLADD